MTIQNTEFKISVKHKKGKTIFYTDLRFVYTKCDFSPICCRTNIRKIFEVSTLTKISSTLFFPKFCFGHLTDFN